MSDFRSLAICSLSSSLWLARNYTTFRVYLRKNHGISGLAPVMTWKWHRGSKYFRAVAANGEQLFIKADGDYHLLENEVNACTSVRPTAGINSRFPNLRFYDFMDEYRFAAFDWIDGEPLSRFLLREQTKENVLFVTSEIVQALEDIGRAGIVHRDFTPENLLVTLDNATQPRSIVLIDFAFAVRNRRAPLDRFVPWRDLQVLCHGYKADDFTWDDAYSCLKILDSIEKRTRVADPALRVQVTNRLGSLVFRLDPESEKRARVNRF